MKPIVELLIQDIEDEKTDIENLSPNDFKQVFETYNGFYNRCINLKEEDFDSAESYHRFVKNVKMLHDNKFITLDWLKNGVDSTFIDKFSELREMLNSFIVLLKNAW
ncbi:hypothetical protein [Flavobacterium ajazii]|uniref:hypothetical protein n=1 Tax=Flavobacterium ajazii TaxID=2692318 RepID=UPI0013D1BCE7|nr:hypothetical protein [Flavobacterium ajazii]